MAIPRADHPAPDGATPRSPRPVKSHPETWWQLQTAKARFSEVFRRARSEGPQWVTRQDKEAVVILPAEEFERLTARARQTPSLSKFFAESPLAKADLDLEPSRDFGREVEL